MHTRFFLVIVVCGGGVMSEAAAQPAGQPDKPAASSLETRTPSVPAELQAALENMQSAQRRLRARQTDAQTQRLQREAAARLELAVEALAQQLERQGTPQPQAQDTPGDPEASESDPQATSNSTAENERPDSEERSRPDARDSTERTGSADDPLIASERRRMLLQGVWGHLRPELQREILDLGDERPLPKYDDLVKRYFQSLATEPDRTE